jgi:hypothetical protein
MIDTNELAQSGKQRREALERKKVMVQLSKDIGFESRMFSIEFKHNTKEDLRYYLWMRELELWLANKYPTYCKYDNTVTDQFELELVLTYRIKTLNA